MAAEDRDRWNQRFLMRARAWEEGEELALAGPGRFLDEVAAYLPGSGRALDVAGGTGRFGVALAERGLDVSVADISDVGLDLVRRRAAAAGVAVDTLELDLDVDPLPPGPWHLIFVHHFLDRALWGVAAEALAPGGVLAHCHPTATNLERHERPSRRFLLEPGELEAAVVGLGLEILWSAEGWTPEGRHEARVVARRGAPQTAGA